MTAPASSFQPQGNFPFRSSRLPSIEGREAMRTITYHIGAGVSTELIDRISILFQGTHSFEEHARILRARAPDSSFSDRMTVITGNKHFTQGNHTVTVAIPPPLANSGCKFQWYIRRESGNLEPFETTVSNEPHPRGFHTALVLRRAPQPAPQPPAHPSPFMNPEGTLVQGQQVYMLFPGAAEPILTTAFGTLNPTYERHNGLPLYHPNGVAQPTLATHPSHRAVLLRQVRAHSLPSLPRAASVSQHTAAPAASPQVNSTLAELRLQVTLLQALLRAALAQSQPDQAPPLVSAPPQSSETEADHPHGSSTPPES